MSDGWGKMPTNEDWPTPKKETPYDDSWGKPVVDWPAPAVSDGWGTKSVQDWLTPRVGKCGECGTGSWTEGDAFPPCDDSYCQTPRWQETTSHQQREDQWTHNALEGAQNRAAVINALYERKDEYTIDRDGELSNVQEVKAKVKGEPVGWYLCYKEKWLHAIISGPYDTVNDALLRSERAWAMFTEDEAFKLAFSNKFNLYGLYCAEIPLSLKRKGAYGRLE